MYWSAATGTTWVIMSKSWNSTPAPKASPEWVIQYIKYNCFYKAKANLQFALYCKPNTIQKYQLFPTWTPHILVRGFFPTSRNSEGVVFLSKKAHFSPKTINASPLKGQSGVQIHLVTEVGQKLPKWQFYLDCFLICIMFLTCETFRRYFVNILTKCSWFDHHYNIKL